MSTTRTGEQFQTTHRPHQMEPAMRMLRDRSIMYKGLCTNCEKLETCSYPSTTSETWFCEEYSYAKPVPMLRLDRRDSDEEEQPRKVLGLCMNCELRETCRFPKPEGGVWFCAEYQ
jgi:hypothetical protein